MKKIIITQTRIRKFQKQIIDRVIDMTKNTCKNGFHLDFYLNQKGWLEIYTLYGTSYVRPQNEYKLFSVKISPIEDWLQDIDELDGKSERTVLRWVKNWLRDDEFAINPQLDEAIANLEEQEIIKLR